MFKVLLFVFLSLNLLSSTLEEAKTASKTRNYKQAIKLWTDLAKDTNPEAQYRLG